MLLDAVRTESPRLVTPEKDKHPFWLVWLEPLRKWNLLITDSRLQAYFHPYLYILQSKRHHWLLTIFLVVVSKPVYSVLARAATWVESHHWILTAAWAVSRLSYWLYCRSQIAAGLPPMAYSPDYNSSYRLSAVQSGTADNTYRTDANSCLCAATWDRFRICCK